MQEEEDAMHAQQLQNDYYTGNRPPTAKPQRATQSHQVEDLPDTNPVYERLIPDPRDELMGAGDWDLMDEHIPAARNMGGGH